MSLDEGEIPLTLHSRPSTAVTLSVPVDTQESLKRVAAERDTSVEALMKFYIGQGLRQDLARMFSERVLETTARILARHAHSPEEIEAILREIRSQAA